jgi:hypothetical protein
LSARVLCARMASARIGSHSGEALT